MIKNIIHSIKTTIIGLLLFGIGIYYVITKETIDYIPMSILFIGGIGFILFPDDMLKQLKEYIKQKKTNEL